MADAHATWLIRSDRACLPLLRDLLGPAVTAISAEVGEEFRLWQTSGDVNLCGLVGLGLVRFAMPVDLTLSTRSLVELELGDCRPITELALVSSIRQAQVFALRRHGRFAVAKLSPILGERLGQGTDRQLPTLIVAVGDDETYVGITPMQATGAVTAGGWTGPPMSHYPSRAAGKLAEALDWLETLGYHPRPTSTWLELGAFPGGMTTALVERGFHVVAVDVNPPSEDIIKLPNVTYHATSAEMFSINQQVDGLLSDMNGPPSQAAPTVARLCANLKTGGWLIHTLKLSRWADLPSDLAMIRSLFRAAGIEEIGVKHLICNRQEITYLGRKHEQTRQGEVWPPT